MAAAPPLPLPPFRRRIGKLLPVERGLERPFPSRRSVEPSESALLVRARALGRRRAGAAEEEEAKEAAMDGIDDDGDI